MPAKLNQEAIKKSFVADKITKEGNILTVTWEKSSLDHEDVVNRGTYANRYLAESEHLKARDAQANFETFGFNRSTSMRITGNTGAASESEMGLKFDLTDSAVKKYLTGRAAGRDR
jgi:hypothetical protein